MPFCHKCRAFIVETAKFCGECGANASEADTTHAPRLDDGAEANNAISIDEQIQKNKKNATHSMLNAAYDGMDENGIRSDRTVENVPCFSCGKEIEMTKEKHVNAGGNFYHERCFTCATCNALLEWTTSYQVEGKFYCALHHGKNLDACAGCGKQIDGQELDALGTHWHPNCFNCSKCKLNLSDKPSRDHEGKPYCKLCFAMTFPELAAIADRKENPPACQHCSHPINGNLIEKDGSLFHSECFDKFKAVSGKQCSKCNEPCSKWVQANDKFFHPECWKCYNCELVLSEGKAGVKKGKFWCNLCIADPFRDFD